jgi:hypothetical protein
VEVSARGVDGEPAQRGRQVELYGREPAACVAAARRVDADEAGPGCVENEQSARSTVDRDAARIADRKAADTGSARGIEAPGRLGHRQQRKPPIEGEDTSAADVVGDVDRVLDSRAKASVPASRPAQRQGRNGVNAGADVSDDVERAGASRERESIGCLDPGLARL